MNSSKTVPQTSADMKLTDSQQLPTSDTLLSQSLGSSADSLSQNQLANGLTANATNNNALNTLNNNRSGMMSGGYGSSMYNSGFSSYGGGFGSSYGGGMYGSNSYMGMGMGGYSGMGGGMMMNQQNLQQGQQPGFRDEYQGVLNGFNSMLNIMGAGIGMVGYGTTFFQITKKALVFIFKGMSNLSYRILGIAYLKKLYNWVTSAELQQDFAKAFELTTKVEKQSFAKKFLGKALIVIRVLSGLALLGFYFTQQNLRKRMMQMKKDQENFNNFDNELGPLIYDNEALPKTDKKDIDLITINMNSDKAEILDELDHNLTQEEIEEEKENFQGSTNEQEDHTDIELTDSKEDVHITDGNLQNAFENIMTQEKNYIQQTQVRSEEFWKHTEPATEPIAEININNNVIPTYNNPFIFNTISEQNNVVSTPEIEMNLPNFNNTMSEIVTPSQNTILPNLTSSVSTLSSQPATAVKKSVKPWMKNVQQQ